MYKQCMREENIRRFTDITNIFEARQELFRSTCCETSLKWERKKWMRI